MKKVFLLMMTLIMTMSFVACGAETKEITLVSKGANYINLLLPDDFSDFEDKNDVALSTGRGASVAITQIMESDVTLEDLTEEYLVELGETSYTNIEVLEYKNPTTIGGVDATSILYKGKGGSSDDSKTVCHITLIYTLDDILCQQQIVFTYLTDEKTSIETKMNEIIESITLE